MTDIIDPIDGLIRYAEEIKPYHSKVIEVLTEYVYNERVSVTVTDRFVLDVSIVVSGVNVEDTSEDSIIGTYDVGPFDASSYWPVISVNMTLPDGAFDGTSLGYNSDENTVAIPGDQTPIYREGRNVIVELGVLDTDSGLTVNKSSQTFTIIDSQFENNSQTNGIKNTPLTRLELSGLADVADYPALRSNETWVATVKLTPTDVDSVVTGYLPPADENLRESRYSNSIIFDKNVENSYPFGRIGCYDLDIR